MTQHTDTTIALVTGATQGIGRETVRQLAARGWTVWLGARDTERGAKVAAEIAAELDPATDPDIRVVGLDVTDDESVAGAARTVQEAHGRLDVLVNNAGVAGPWIGPRETTAADFIDAYGVNVLGPVRTTHAFLPLLDASPQPRVVMVSSGLGSMGITTDPSRFESTFVGLVYQSSKAALNMVTTQYAKALPGYQVSAIDPGYTSTALNNFQGEQTVEEGTRAIVTAATADPSAPTSTFTNAAGPLPW